MKLTILLPLLLVAPASAQDAPPARTLSGAGLEVVLREVADLLEPQPPGAADAEPRDPEILREQAGYLEAFIVRNIEPPILTEARRVAVNGTTLITFLDPPQEAWVERFLARQREAVDTIYDVTCRFLTLAPDTAARFGSGSEPRLLSTSELETLLNAAAAEDGVETLSAPRLLGGRMQRCTIAVTSARTFIEGWDEHERVEPGGQSLVVPRIRVVDEGVTLACRVTPLPDGLLSVDFGATLTEVQDPVEVRSTPYGPIAVPEVATRRVESEVRIESGDTLLFPGLGTDAREVVVLLRVAEVRAEAVPERSSATPAPPVGQRRAAERR